MNTFKERNFDDPKTLSWNDASNNAEEGGIIAGNEDLRSTSIEPKHLLCLVEQ